MIKPILAKASVILIPLLLGVSSVAGCNKGASSETPLITAAQATGPAGYAWAKANIPNVASYDLPSGGKWQKDGLGASNEKSDFTIMVQMQGGVEASDRAAFMKGVVDANKHDAPKYQVVAQQMGQINGMASGRVDGKFDNGTVYATRDYVLFRNHVALAVMVRGPVAKQAEVQSIADHVAASLK